MSNFARTPIKMIFIICICFGVSLSGAIAASQTPPKGCPLQVSVQQADAFVRGQIAELASASAPLIQKMQAISNKAKKPGVSIGKQLSAQDARRFNKARHKYIQIGGQQLYLGHFKRDVHLIAATYDVAKMADLYEMKKSDLADASPLRFYYTVLEALRIAQPRVSVTPLVSVGIGCDPEAGLYWEEQILERQLADEGADQRYVNMIFDVERLRTFYRLSWNLLIDGTKDVRATKWVGGNAKSPNTFKLWLMSSGAAIQRMYNAIIPYVDKNLPAEEDIEASFMQKEAQNVARDYPVLKK